MKDDGKSSPRTDYALSEQRDRFPLRFLSYSHPSQSKGLKFRQTVRRHNARLQHEKARASKYARGRDLSPEGARSRESSNSDASSARRKLVAEQKEAHPLRGEADGAALSPSDPSSQFDAQLAARRIEDSEQLEPYLTQQVAKARVDPFSTFDPTLDWTVDVPSVLDRYLENARSYLISQRMRKVSQALHARLVKPRLFLNGLLFNALTTLAVTSVPAFDEHPQADPMILWLRTNFLMAIQAAVRERSYNPNALAIGIALLIAWELDVGNPSLCQLHLRALPNIIDTDPAPDVPKVDSMYHGQEIDKPFRGGKEIPPGFEFYRSQKLLPPSLMFYVGSLVYWDKSAPGASIWMRQLWGSIAACGPRKGIAQRALAQHRMSTRVAQLVRQAGIMLGSFMRSEAGEKPVAQPQVSGIQAQWHSTLLHDWNSLIGSVFDEIVLWCLCVFCITSGYQDKHHLEAISSLLSALEVESLESLSALLSTYVWPTCVRGPLAELCSISPDLFDRTKNLRV